MYRAILAYDPDGEFVGYAIQKVGTLKLEGSNLYAESEKNDLLKQIERLNDSFLVRQYWPDGNDPEVQALLDDPTFEPSTETEVITMPVLDRDASTIVYDGNGIADEEKSELVYYNTTITQPVNGIERGHKALELVARRRAANANSN